MTVMPVYIAVDDIDRHGAGCMCGTCDMNGKSYGAAVRKVSIHEEDPLERHYAASESSAIQNAEAWCKEKGLKVVDFEADTKVVSGKVTVSFEALVNHPREELLRMFAEELVGCGLDEMEFCLLSAEGNTLTISVCGTLTVDSASTSRDEPEFFKIWVQIEKISGAPGEERYEDVQHADFCRSVAIAQTLEEADEIMEAIEVQFKNYEVVEGELVKI